MWYLYPYEYCFPYPHFGPACKWCLSVTPRQPCLCQSVGEFLTIAMNDQKCLGFSWTNCLCSFLHSSQSTASTSSTRDSSCSATTTTHPTSCRSSTLLLRSHRTPSLKSSCQVSGDHLTTLDKMTVFSFKSWEDKKKHENKYCLMVNYVWMIVLAWRLLQ